MIASGIYHIVIYTAEKEKATILDIRLENNTLQSRPQKMVMTIHFIMKIIRRMMEESMTIRQSMWMKPPVIF